ncbi:hypothetical protein FHQ08_06180 [Lactobacillus sp. CC-MHH1034]|uniref:hypothetical protein n=1 Tax=Agrilactobacillus fermenti TaxID=2586909 RepID=UPI001E291A62|nr:hypothetical protein [Agrilactobacillus fermenti]MCD2256305.1 hypothetical protein [Agrilactobacillus fermenti]
MDYVYLLMSVVLLVILGLDLLKLKFRSRMNWLRLTIGIIIAGLSFGSIKYFNTDLIDASSNIFIGIAFLVFACWQRGLSNWGVIGGLNAVKPYPLVTHIQIIQLKPQDTQVVCQFGTLQRIKLRFKASPQMLQQFLREHSIPDKRIEVEMMEENHD